MVRGAEPQLGAFFWITPIPGDWPKTRVESKLREYNVYNLRLLVIHEAMPGHYVQGEFANDIQPKTRRVLRSAFGNGPYAATTKFAAPAYLLPLASSSMTKARLSPATGESRLGE